MLFLIPCNLLKRRERVDPQHDYHHHRRWLKSSPWHCPSRALYSCTLLSQLNMSANSSPLFHCHSDKILFCQLLNISQLKSNIFLQLFWPSRYPKFFLWGLNQDSREVVWSLCVHGRRANNQLQKSHNAVYAFLWDCTALFLSRRSCTMLIQPEQHFTLSGTAGCVPVDLYIVVGLFVDYNNWLGLRIWNELLLQPFLIIRVVHVVVVISTFETDRNIIRALGMKPRSPPEKEPMFLKSRNGYFKSEMFSLV